MQRFIKELSDKNYIYLIKNLLIKNDNDKKF